MATVECEGCSNEVDSKSIVCRNCGTPVGYESSQDVRAGPDARPRFCTNCGSPVEPDGDFCQTCGSAIGLVPRAVVEPGLTDAGHLRHILSPERVVLMCILSSGFYLFYWFYLTWKHYRDHTGKEAFPATTLSAGWAVFALVIITVFGHRDLPPQLRRDNPGGRQRAASNEFFQRGGDRCTAGPHTG